MDISEMPLSALGVYRGEYDLAAQQWKGGGGPDSSKCQYYQATSLAIFVQLGEGSELGGEIFLLSRLEALWF